MFGPEFMEEIERTRDRIEVGLALAQQHMAQAVTLFKIAVGALLVCAVSLVWIATETLR